MTDIAKPPRRTQDSRGAVARERSLSRLLALDLENNGADLNPSLPAPSA